MCLLQLLGDLQVRHVLRCIAPCSAQKPSQSMCTKKVRVLMDHCDHEIWVSCGEAAVVKVQATQRDCTCFLPDHLVASTPYPKPCWL